MVPEYKAVYRRVEHKIFKLGKLRYVIDRRAALLVYICRLYITAPGLYAAFVLISCGKGYKKDMQILQSNAPRICPRYCMVDHVTIEQLHEEANLSLEQRRIFQILKLLYDCSKGITYLKNNSRSYES